MECIVIQENGLEIRLGINEEGVIGILYFGELNPHPDQILKKVTKECSLLELQLAGAGDSSMRGMKFAGTLPGSELCYLNHEQKTNSNGNQWLFTLSDKKRQIEVTAAWQFFAGLPILRSSVEVKNITSESVGLEYIASFKLPNFDRSLQTKKSHNVIASIPHNSWSSELNWKQLSLDDLGLDSDDDESSKRIYVGNTATWSCNQYVPMALLQNRDIGGHFFFQIETPGSWNWEVNSEHGITNLLLSGPNQQDNQWFKELPPGAVFETIPAAIGFATGSESCALQVLTDYRRKIRRENADNQELPVIFNDYMNCLWGDPTTEKELPLIEAAAAAGCEIYCIDCGWYADRNVSWWPSIGDWQPSKERFPEGLAYVLQRIREKGMVPGLWLEIESVGVNSQTAQEMPDDWFFVRNDRRVIDRDRLQLDFRNEAVRAFASSVMKRLVEEYGVGYIKMDYNINAGPGTEINSDSLGDGLLSHNRAYLSWLAEIFEKYPQLVIENCSSGGLRMDYAMLAHCSLQSITDQADRTRNSAIASLAATAVTPEQAAIWSYPAKEDTQEEVIINMVNAMLLRVHQSGFLHELAPETFELVSEGIDCYKEQRQLLRSGSPFWPAGITKKDDYGIYGIRADAQLLLAVWNYRLDTELDLELDLTSHLPNGKRLTQAEMTYPITGFAGSVELVSAHRLKLTLPAGTSRLFRCQFGNA